MISSMESIIVVGNPVEDDETLKIITTVQVRYKILRYVPSYV
jgi:hypothetical protein